MQQYNDYAKNCNELPGLTKSIERGRYLGHCPITQSMLDNCNYKHPLIDSEYMRPIRLIILLTISLLAVSCRTERNGYYKMPVDRYDLSVERTRMMNTASSSDTLILLTLHCSGCNRGMESSTYGFFKEGNQTRVERTSNHAKYKPLYICDTLIKWNEITSNIFSYKTDIIKRYYKMIHGGVEKTVLPAASHGYWKTIQIKFYNVNHIASLVSYTEKLNRNNINLILIEDLTNVVYNRNWKKSEKIKYRKSR